MSYCRLGPDSDIYVFCNDRKNQIFMCCHCPFRGKDTFQGYDAIIEHITDHERIGHKVPFYVIDWLKSEKENPPQSVLDDPNFWE